MWTRFSASYRYDSWWWWRVLTILNGVGTVPPLIVYLTEAGVPTALAISILLFLAASGLGYLIYVQGQSGMRVSGVRWDKLGRRSDRADTEGRGSSQLR